MVLLKHPGEPGFREIWCRLLSRNLLGFWVLPLFVVILQFCFEANSSESSMWVALHPVWVLVWWIFLCTVVQKLQRVCEFLQGCYLRACSTSVEGLAGPQEWGCPTHLFSSFFSTKLFFICQDVTPANRLAQTLFQTFISCFSSESSEQNMLLPSHTGLQAALLPICRNTHILLLF